MKGKKMKKKPRFSWCFLGRGLFVGVSGKVRRKKPRCCFFFFLGGGGCWVLSFEGFGVFLFYFGVYCWLSWKILVFLSFSFLLIFVVPSWEVLVFFGLLGSLEIFVCCLVKKKDYEPNDFKT